MTEPNERTLALYGPSMVIPILQFVPMIVASFLVPALTTQAWGWWVPILTLLLFTVRVLYRMQFSWRLTSDRIIEYRGILVRVTNVVRFTNITDMRVHRPVLSSIFGTGHLNISTAGNDGYQLAIFSQHNPTEIERHIAHAKREYLQRYGYQTPPTPH